MQSAKELREACRSGDFSSQTSGLAYGHVQANLVILPKEWAKDFLLFAKLNPKPCPVLEVGEVGDYKTHVLADNSDIRTDLPKYRVFVNGEIIEELNDISSKWQDDFVYFLLGCSFSFEQALIEAGLEIRHISENKNVPMYKTNLMCNDAGRFKNCPTVVSMRPFSKEDAQKATDITKQFPGVHGSPVFVGDPKSIGIKDINKPDWGDGVSLKEGEVCAFWACGVTPQMAAVVAKPPIMITHAPGHMFVGDKLNSDFKTE